MGQLNDNKVVIALKQTPPAGSKVVDNLPNGDPIYERTVMKTTKVPVLDDKGEQEWVRNQVSGQRIIPMWKLEVSEEKERFYLFDDQKGNIFITQYTAETAAETLHRENRLAVANLTEDLATAMAAEGVTVDDLMNAIRAKKPKLKEVA